MIYELEVFGFAGGWTYTVGKNFADTNLIVKAIQQPVNQHEEGVGFMITYENGEKHFIEGSFQFISKMKAKDK